jgi:hypothetical protein
MSVDSARGSGTIGVTCARVRSGGHAVRVTVGLFNAPGMTAEEAEAGNGPDRTDVASTAQRITIQAAASQNGMVAVVFLSAVTGYHVHEWLRVGNDKGNVSVSFGGFSSTIRITAGFFAVKGAIKKSRLQHKCWIWVRWGVQSRINFIKYI